MEKRDCSFPPGQHGRETQFKRGRTSDYTSQLREKQKARRIYGVLERQFRRYFAEAARRAGPTGTNLLVQLETRLDNVIYRLGLADSRAHARQLVTHKHIAINGIATNIASYQVRPNDVITVYGRSKNMQYFREIANYMSQRPRAPEWLAVRVGSEGVEASMLRAPERGDIELPLNEQLIVEYYSR
jgi:small subunit ribosomal protein S4